MLSWASRQRPWPFLHFDFSGQAEFVRNIFVPEIAGTARDGLLGIRNGRLVGRSFSGRFLHMSPRANGRALSAEFPMVKKAEPRMVSRLARPARLPKTPPGGPPPPGLPRPPARRRIPDVRRLRHHRHQICPAATGGPPPPTSAGATAPAQSGPAAASGAWPKPCLVSEGRAAAKVRIQALIRACRSQRLAEAAIHQESFIGVAGFDERAAPPPPCRASALALSVRFSKPWSTRLLSAVGEGAHRRAGTQLERPVDRRGSCH